VLGAWYDGRGSANPDFEEIADKCQWWELGNVTLSDGTYPMQRLWSNASSYCVVAHRPTVSRLAVSGGPVAGGTAVTVDGTQLLGGSVMFGTVPAAGSCTPTSCVVQSPPGSLGIVDVRVTTSGGQSANSLADRFSYNIGPGEVTAANGHCLKDAHSSALNGNKIDIWTCANGRLGQIWLLAGNHSLRVVGKCLGLTGLRSGARAVLAGCARRAGQYWQVESASAGLVEYRNPASRLCLTDPGNSTANGTAVGSGPALTRLASIGPPPSGAFVTVGQPVIEVNVPMSPRGSPRAQRARRAGHRRDRAARRRRERAVHRPLPQGSDRRARRRAASDP
jgi:hypothetical protein